MIDFIEEWWPLGESLLRVPLVFSWLLAFVGAYGRPKRDARWLLGCVAIALLCAAVATVVVPSEFGNDLLGFRMGIALATLATAAGIVELWSRGRPRSRFAGGALACIGSTLVGIVPFLLLLLAFAMNPD